ncbi:hypothetical protein JJL45_11325 [Tamlana sp. s12]|uniref:hypothetical protein n=1 Tax=Tamlana sp. s12 TaxID=1630406 RepID=UPI0007FE65E5|nr:hypothetical protein [Tamlana sp. s12]OBQ51802.1 hypothetical protein VQ01_15100 [Tamlana sp. s12]QQY81515.1 hypothetical protein JJL45_11325 [Tamlana sp. s12]
MKTSYLLSILALLSIYSLHPQEKDYSFSRLNTRKQTLRGQSVSNIYSVSYAKNIESINPEYSKFKRELDTLIADSISINTGYNKALIKFNDLSTIKSNVVTFNSSEESFRQKVKLLKEAQILASKHHIKELLYSDNEINTEMKAGFILLKLNMNNLEAHLNRVLSRLDDKIIQPEAPIYVSTADLRRQLSNIKKTKNDNSSNTTKGYMLETRIIPPEDIAGDFRLVNSFFVLKISTKGFSKNQLVSKSMIYKLGISRKKLLSNKAKMLIQNKITNDMYLVDHSFLDHFSVKS